MSDGKSYRVSIKVRNANLLRAIERKGLSPGKALSELAGISYGRLNDLINMTRVPTMRDGSLHPEVESLCVFLDVMPCTIFDAMQMHDALQINTSEFDADANDVAVLSSKTSPSSLQNAVDSALGNLRGREAQVVRLRYGIDCAEHTFDSIAEILDVTPQRIRQIEATALRKMRWPSGSASMRIAIEKHHSIGEMPA